MNTLERSITTLNDYMTGCATGNTDVRAQLIVAIAYIVAVITVPVSDPGSLVWLMCYPIIMAEVRGPGYGRLFCKSLLIAPIIFAVAIFNPIMEHEPMFAIGGVVISHGWVMFVCVMLRGLLSFQALLLLIGNAGFIDVCRAMGRLGVPDILVTQLMMLYRYLIVIMQEALAMHRSRQSRGFGRRSYPLAMWGTFIGQLLIRSVKRSSRVSQAMDARGFDGRYRMEASTAAMKSTDWIYICCWCVIFLILRIVNLSALFERLL